MAGIMAPEDIAIDTKTQTAFISSLDRRLVTAQNASSSGTRGSIRTLDLSSVKPGAEISFKDVTPDMPKRFHPLGLSLFTGEDGTRRLFVINQADGDAHVVEIFRLTSDKMMHEKTIELGADVEFANDVLATGPDSFYVTDSAGSTAVTRSLNFALQRRNSKVFYFDGNKITQVASDFVMANGIAMSKNGEQIYVLDTFSRSLRFLKRDVTSGLLENNGLLFIGTGVDNIDVAEDGSLWMATHPRLIDFALYAIGLKAESSSQVIHAVPGKKGGGEVRTRYLDLGKEISGSSVAVAYKDGFIIGSALDNKLVICTGK